MRNLLTYPSKRAIVGSLIAVGFLCLAAWVAVSNGCAITGGAYVLTPDSDPPHTSEAK